MIIDGSKGSSQNADVDESDEHRQHFSASARNKIKNFTTLFKGVFFINLLLEQYVHQFSLSEWNLLMH